MDLCTYHGFMIREKDYIYTVLFSSLLFHSSLSPFFTTFIIVCRFIPLVYYFISILNESQLLKVGLPLLLICEIPFFTFTFTGFYVFKDVNTLKGQYT